MEYTFVMIKPDGVEKHIYVDVLKRFLREGLSIQNVDIIQLDKDLLDKHYSHIINKPFYTETVKYMLSNKVIIMVVKGENAIEKVREIIGSTDPKKAGQGTIRATYGKDIGHNVIHASDSLSNAKLEINRFGDYQKKLIKNNEQNY